MSNLEKIAENLAFSKSKWLLKSCADRTVTALWKRFGEILDRFTKRECRNYFRHCGYRRTYG